MTARVFKSGKGRAVRLPKEFHVMNTQLETFRRGDEIVLREPANGLARAFELLTSLTPPDGPLGASWEIAYPKEPQSQLCRALQ
jgi:antitoxin VapB